MVKILNDFKGQWQRTFQETSTDAVQFSRLSVVAMTQLSAIIAVDVGMTLDQFTNVCRAQHEAAYQQAPKFG